MKNIKNIWENILMDDNPDLNNGPGANQPQQGGSANLVSPKNSPVSATAASQNDITGTVAPTDLLVNSKLSGPAIAAKPSPQPLGDPVLAPASASIVTAKPSKNPYGHLKTHFQKLPKFAVAKNKATEHAKKINPTLLGILAGIAVLVTANLAIGYVNMGYFQKKAVTIGHNIFIDGLDMSAKKPEDAKQLLQAAANAQLVTLVVSGQKIEAPAVEMGISRSIDTAVEQALSTKRPLLQKLNLAEKNQLNIAVPVTVSQKKLDEYISTTLGGDLIAQNAKLAVSGDDFSVSAGVDGLAVDIDKLAKDMTGLKLTDTKLQINTSTKPVKPIISTAVAETAKAKASSLIAAEYSVGNETVGYKTLSANKKVKWVTISENLENKTIDVALNNAAALADIESVAKSFNQAAAEKVSVLMPDSGEIILEEGNDGMLVADSEVANAKAQANKLLAGGQPAKITIATTPVARGQRTMNGEAKMVLVDVPRYTTYALQDGKIINQAVVSTGKKGHETPAGRYSVQFKVAESDMKGCAFDGCWFVPHVKWQTYFTNQGHALHAAYWYVNWGHQNVSHGCVNMHEADAKWFYDWTEVGTPVVVVR